MSNERNGKRENPLDEMIETLQAWERLSFLAEKAGVFKSGLKNALKQSPMRGQTPSRAGQVTRMMLCRSPRKGEPHQ